MRSVAIITGPLTHLDHLGVLSTELKIPLIVTEEILHLAAKKYYPEIDVYLKDYVDLSMEFLARHYEVIYETAKFWAVELGPMIELLFRKKMHFVYCPHGNSDKGHSLKFHACQDVSLVYGDHLQDLLQNTKASKQIKHIVRTGNYRYPFYLKHKAFYDTLVEEEVFSHFKYPKKTILYAPTWQDKENLSSFFHSTDTLINQLSDEFNLLIKLHPFLSEDRPAEVYSIIARYENHPSVFILKDFPPIYPLLSRSDVYIGDYSSIGYDFLVFNRPMYFLTAEQQDYQSPLEKCGHKLPLTSYKNVLDFIQKTIKTDRSNFSSIRKDVYSYAFSETFSPKAVSENINFKLKNIEN